MTYRTTMVTITNPSALLTRKKVIDITASDYVRIFFSGSRPSQGEVSDILRCAIAEVP